MVGKSTISALFGRSPVKPLQDHIRIVTECAAEVPGLVQAACQGDAAEIKVRAERIDSLESQADDVKNELRVHLPKSLFMPVDRRDLLEILDLQDEIADTAQDIASLVSERDMTLPEDMHELMHVMVNRCVDACNHASKIIHELDELVATGFGGRESEMVFQMVEALNKIESDTDEMGRNLTRGLFSHEADMGAVSVILWHQLIEKIGNLADFAEKVGNRLRLLLAR